MIDMQSLAALLDDDSLVRKYLDRFVQDMPVLMEHMHSAVAHQQWEQLQLHAHTYKSQAQYLNASTSIRIASTLEQLCTDSKPDRDRIEQLLNELKKELRATIHEIRQING